MPTFHRILVTTALCLATVAVAPIHAECSLAYLQPEQAQEVIDIYRHTPELSSYYESRCNWVFVPMLYHEITPDCYLLCVEVGSGAIIYLFSLVKKQPDGSLQLLNHTIMSPGYPGRDLRCKLENDRYFIEILCGKEWSTVFTGRFSQPTRAYQYINVSKGKLFPRLFHRQKNAGNAQQDARRVRLFIRKSALSAIFLLRIRCWKYYLM